MRELTPETITDAVLDQMSTTSDPRMREVMASAVKHLHAFARDVNLTPGEWLKGIAFKRSGHSQTHPPRLLLNRCPGGHAGMTIRGGGGLR